MYYVAPELRTQGYLPPHEGGSDHHSAVRVVSAGTRVLTCHRRCGTWLLTQAGARLLGPHARRQVLHLAPADLAELLHVPKGNARAVRGLRHTVPIARLPPTARAAVEKAQLQHGAVLLTCDAPASRSAPGQRLLLPARLTWREPRVKANGGGGLGRGRRNAPMRFRGRALALALTLQHPRGLEQLPQAFAAATRMQLQVPRR